MSVEESTKVFTFPFPTDKFRFHPSQKLPALFEILVKRKSNENDIVLDCFSGSGTTAIACVKLNRNFICIEKNKNFYDRSVERLKDCSSQLSFQLI